MSLGATATGPERQWVDRIRRPRQRLARTVERMFKLVRTRSSARRSTSRRVHLEPLRRTGRRRSCRPYLEHAASSVEIEVDPELGARSRSTRRSSSDVLINLLANAIKFTPDGARSGSVGQEVPKATRTGSASRSRTRVSASTRGEQPYLFEPFFTGFDTLHHSSGDYQFGKRGIGLGLCLVKTFVELHGGRVEFQKHPGRGSRFGFVLPRRQRPAPVAPIRTASRAGSGRRSEPRLRLGTVMSSRGRRARRRRLPVFARVGRVGTFLERL